MQIVDVAKNIQRFLKPYFAEKQVVLTTERCGIMITNKVCSLVHADYNQDKLILNASEQFAFDDSDKLPGLLAKTVNRYQMHGVPTYIVLSPEDYQIFLIESMPVQQSEFDEALQWRIKSLLSYPVEDAAIDHFQLPNKKAATETKMIAAVVSKNHAIKKVSSLVTDSGLNLSSITIPELALRNLAAQYENDEKSTAVIYFYEHIAILNITRQKTLYFTRHLNLMVNADGSINYQELSLDILRYFDYFQSQWRNPSPTRIYIATSLDHAAQTAKSLTDLLMIQVDFLTFHITNNNENQSIKSDCILPLGSMLKMESADAATGN